MCHSKINSAENELGLRSESVEKDGLKDEGQSRARQEVTKKGSERIWLDRTEQDRTGQDRSVKDRTRQGSK